jgi:hypothetical protein
MARFTDFETEGARWITIVESDFYSDYLDDAKNHYAECLDTFRGSRTVLRLGRAAAKAVGLQRI